MNRSTIPYSIVEERRRLNKCIENAPNECEREIYKKIRDMKIPYDKLDTILETSKELIKKKEKQRNPFLCHRRRKEAYTQEDDRIKNQEHGSLSA